MSAYAIQVELICLVHQFERAAVFGALGEVKRNKSVGAFQKFVGGVAILAPGVEQWGRTAQTVKADGVFL